MGGMEDVHEHMRGVEMIERHGRLETARISLSSKERALLEDMFLLVGKFNIWAQQPVGGGRLAAQCASERNQGTRGGGAGAAREGQKTNVTMQLLACHWRSIG